MHSAQQQDERRIDAELMRDSALAVEDRPAVVTEQTLRWVLLLCLLGSFAWIAWPVPLFDVDEGAFSEATREMLARGDFVTTYLDGDLRFDKPILTYWCQGLSASLFGLNEFAMRLPSALAGVAWVLALVRFGAGWSSERRGLLAGIALATCLQATLIGKAAIADSLLNLFLALSMFAGYRFSRTGERTGLWLCYVFAALGFLTKGPVAVLIPAATALLLYTSRKDFGGMLRLLDPVGIGLFLLVAAPWYILEYAAHGNEFVEGFFLEHNVSRFSTTFEGHGGSLLYYIPVVLVGILPFSGLLLVSLSRVREWFRDDLDRFCALWFLFVVVFFSLSGTKLHHYVVYGYPPLFLLLAKTADRLRRHAWVTVPAALLLGFLLLVPQIAEFATRGVEDDFVRAVASGARSVFGPEYRLLVCACGVALLSVMLNRRYPVSLKLGFVGLICALAVNGVALPAAGTLLQSHVKEAGLFLRGRSEPFHMAGVDTPSLLFYARRVSARGQELEPGDWVFTKVTLLDSLPELTVRSKRWGTVLGRIKDPEP